MFLYDDEEKSEKREIGEKKRRRGSKGETPTFVFYDIPLLGTDKRGAQCWHTAHSICKQLAIINLKESKSAHAKMEGGGGKCIN